MTFLTTSGRSFSSGPLAPTPGVSASSFASSLGGAAVNRYGPTIAKAAIDRIDSTVNDIADVISGKGNKGNSGNSNSSKGSKGKGSDNNGSDNNNSGARGGRRPRSHPNLPGSGGSPSVSGVPKLSLSTGINPGIISNPLQDTTNDFSPLFIQCGCFLPSLDAQKDSYYSKLMNEQLHYKYNVIVMDQVNFSLAKNFTQERFYNYILTISEALQLYYMIDSILAFTSHTPNNNIAMTRLRMGISADISNSHIKLREFLCSTPIPSNLLMFIRHMYQNYSFSDVSGSPIIRLSFSDILCTSESKGGGLNVSVENYKDIFERLIKYSDIASIISKIRKNWVNTDLPASSYEALYDPQFSTFWHNSNIAYEDFGSNAVKYSINAKDFDESIYYGIFGNELDGIIYASCSVNTKEHNVMQMGLWTPFTAFKDRKAINSSLLHLSNDKLIRPVTERQFRSASMVYAAPFTKVNDSGTLMWEMMESSYVGACIPQVHTLNNVIQAVTRSIDWLLAL